ncbi:hypothetical protein CC85DRAFT_284611 [Cutaneotrichosporon oleaginosum]|uniref:Uncharacterized protein n=1 Tax=Cutaneotrichosporon oleaginosum TaxID=879819 RepID=A0A0J0XQ67_9TREE|nr:uncharacterized protein CC85DRAFT_284611 [Cutaneotrichosporon oleaginosum]KLT43265.1 hypothetical protein CC85DRAFT_284611 [Cutaneotrichosporon oleaginosum]TXT14471.1 hypothetical protein COLE_00664 [Cutaneotrichosporon oleaginosum]
MSNSPMLAHCPSPLTSFASSSRPSESRFAVISGAGLLPRLRPVQRAHTHAPFFSRTSAGAGVGIHSSAAISTFPPGRTEVRPARAHVCYVCWG